MNTPPPTQLQIQLDAIMAEVAGQHHFLSSRAASLAGQLALAKAEIEKLKAELAEKQEKQEKPPLKKVP